MFIIFGLLWHGSHICLLIDEYWLYITLTKATSFNNLILKCLLERYFQYVLAAIGNVKFNKTFEELTIYFFLFWEKITLISNGWANIKNRYIFYSWRARSKVNFFFKRKGHETFCKQCKDKNNEPTNLHYLSQNFKFNMFFIHIF